MQFRDDGVCSLPEAVDNANRDQRFWPDCPSGDGPDRLELTSGHVYTATEAWPGTNAALPPVTDDLEILGAGAVLERDSVDAFRLMTILGGSVRIAGMTLRDGRSDDSMIGGGAILVDSAALELDSVLLTGNEARGFFTFGGALRLDRADVTIVDSQLFFNSALSTDPEHGGGAIAQFDGDLTIRRSALLQNFADFNCDQASPDDVASTGGALRVEAAASTGAQTYIYDSTLAYNLARTGGAIHLVAVADTGVGGIQDVFVQLLRSTLVQNEAVSCGAAIGVGDGVHVQQANGGEGLLAFGNSILHGNGRPLNGDINGVDCSANSPASSFASLEGNVLDDDDQCPTTGFDVFVPRLDEVIDTDLNSDHFLPLSDGPAVDLPETGLNCPGGSEDQLGNPRAGGSGQGGALCDAGAIELQNPGAQYTLAVSLAGTGIGTVTSVPVGVDCPGACSADFDDGALVTLEASPDTGQLFAGWSGACSGSGSCSVTMDQARSVTATFNAPSTFPLNVLVSGGAGRVLSDPAGIDCPDTCNAPFANGAVVELTQTPEPGFAFDSWGGACSGDGACFVTMDQARGVSANYTGLNTLTVSVSGDGGVTSIPAGIDCPDTACSADFVPAEKVLLQVEPGPGQSFLGWSGDCSGTGGCVIAMEQDRQVSAAFTSTPSLNTLNLAIAGSGSVTSVSPGIDCPGTCSADFMSGVDVELIATAQPGFEFDRWTGDCTGSGACVVTMNGDRNVTAVFEPIGFELRVLLQGEGTGQVFEIPAPGTIDCPGTCSAVYPSGTEVSLGISVGPDSRFIGYRGDCQGGSCTVTMDQDRTVRAVFLSDEQIFIDSFEQ